MEKKHILRRILDKSTEDKKQLVEGKLEVYEGGQSKSRRDRVRKKGRNS